MDSTTDQTLALFQLNQLRNSIDNLGRDYRPYIGGALQGDTGSRQAEGAAQYAARR